MADVTVIEAREGTELGSYKGEADLAGAAWGGQRMVSGLRAHRGTVAKRSRPKDNKDKG